MMNERPCSPSYHKQSPVDSGCDSYSARLIKISFILSRAWRRCCFSRRTSRCLARSPAGSACGNAPTCLTRLEPDRLLHSTPTPSGRERPQSINRLNCCTRGERSSTDVVFEPKLEWDAKSDDGCAQRLPKLTSELEGSPFRCDSSLIVRALPELLSEAPLRIAAFAFGPIVLDFCIREHFTTRRYRH